MTDEEIVYLIHAHYATSGEIFDVVIFARAIEHCTLTKQKARWYQEGLEAGQRQALAEQPAQQEPVATIGNWGEVMWAKNVFPQLGDKMYAAPPQRTWVGLNKEEAFELQKKYEGKPSSLSAAVENLLREKNYG